jgi:hypothetical protein
LFREFGSSWLCVYYPWSFSFRWSDPNLKRDWLVFVGTRFAFIQPLDWGDILNVCGNIWRCYFAGNTLSNPDSFVVMSSTWPKVPKAKLNVLVSGIAIVTSIK